MVVFLSIIFICLSLLSVLDLIQSRYKMVIYVLTAIFLICVAGLRPAGVDRDYSNYVRMFKNVLFVDDKLVEPTFILITAFLFSFSIKEPVFIFLVYAILGITIKFIAIKQLTNHWFLSVLLLFSCFFAIHDLTQIRAAVAVGFLLLSIVPLYNRKPIPFFLFATLAFLFHFSAVLVFFLWFLRADKISYTVYGLLVPVMYFVYFFSGFLFTDIFLFMPDGLLISKLARYEYITGMELNVFNVWQLIRCALCYFFLYNVKALSYENKYAILLVKIYIIATAVFVLLASNPAIAGRVSDMLSIVDIILIPYLVSLIKPKAAGFVMVVLLAFSYLFLHLYFNKIIL